jgi:hypothetical protein
MAIKMLHDKFSQPQEELLRSFLLSGGENLIGRKFIIQKLKSNIKLFKSESIEFIAQISDEQLIQLAQRNCVILFSDPLSIKFTEKSLHTVKDGVTLLEKEENLDYKREMFAIIRKQVSIWLAASLVACAFFLASLVFLFQQLSLQNIPVGVLSGFISILSGSISTLFIQNYKQANTMLQSFLAQNKDIGNGNKE